MASYIVYAFDVNEVQTYSDGGVDRCINFKAIRRVVVRLKVADGDPLARTQLRSGNFPPQSQLDFMGLLADF